MVVRLLELVRRYSFNEARLTSVEDLDRIVQEAVECESFGSVGECQHLDGVKCLKRCPEEGKD